MKHQFFFSFFILMSTGFSSAFAQQWDLQKCITYALEHNISLKQQENNVELQKISLSSAQNNRLPSLSASASESVSFGRGLTAQNTYANRNTQSTSFDVSTNVPVYTGGQLTNQIKMNKLNLQAAVADLSRARESVCIQVVSAYLEAVYQSDLVEVCKRQKALAEAQQHRVELMLKNGKAAESELAEIRATVAADELALTQQQNSAMLALLDLSQLLELPSPDGFDIVRPEAGDASAVLLASPDNVYAEAMGMKPQIEAEKLRVESAEKAVNVAKAGHLPSVYFSAGMGSSYYKTSGFSAETFSKQMRDNFNQYLGLSLSIPIFDRFSARNSVRTAKVQLHTQQLQLEDAKKTLYKEIQQAYYNALAAQKQCVSSDAAFTSSKVSFQLMEKKYENGKATATEYQESKTSCMKAEANAIQARYTFVFRQKILDFYRGEKLF